MPVAWTPKVAGWRVAGLSGGGMTGGGGGGRSGSAGGSAVMVVGKMAGSVGVAATGAEGAAGGTGPFFAGFGAMLLLGAGDYLGFQRSEVDVRQTIYLRLFLRR